MFFLFFACLGFYSNIATFFCKVEIFVKVFLHVQILHIFVSLGLFVKVFFVCSNFCACSNFLLQVWYLFQGAFVNVQFFLHVTNSFCTLFEFYVKVKSIVMVLKKCCTKCPYCTPPPSWRRSYNFVEHWYWKFYFLNKYICYYGTILCRFLTFTPITLSIPLIF